MFLNPAFSDPFPAETQSCEGDQCKQHRAEMDIGPILDEASELFFIFKNELRNFLESETLCMVRGLGWRIITVEELARLSHLFITPSSEKCPTLVWALDNGIPCLAYVTPCNGDPIQIVKMSPLICRAYTIFVFQE